MTLSIFSTQAPSTNVGVSDGVTYEMGVQFSSSISTEVIAIRYYKPSNESGIHYGHLWDANQNLLATTTFLNETVSGWQLAYLTNPITLIPNVLYISSVSINSFFCNNEWDMLSSIVNNTLSTVAGNNELYGNIGTCPTNAYHSTNYFIDVLTDSTLIMWGKNSFASLL